MTFPDGLTTIIVTGLNLLGFDAQPLSGVVIFTASGAVGDPAADALLEGSAVAQVTSGVMAPVTIPATDAVDPPFAYTITFRLQTPDGSPGPLGPVGNVSIPSSLGETVDISALVPGAPPPAATAFNSDNTWTGIQTLGGDPPLIIPAGAAAGDVLTSDASGHASWQVPTGGSGGGGGISPPAGDLGGTALAPTVTATHLASPLPAVQGGTGQATQQAALDSLAGAVTTGRVLRGNGSHVTLSALQASDIPALAYDASGAAAAAQSAAEAASVPLAGAAMTGQLAPSVVALTDAATITVDASRGNDFRVTIAASRTIASPSSPADGQAVIFWITQGTGGGFSITWGSAYSFGAGSAPVLSTAAGETDMVGFKYNAAKGKWCFTGSVPGF